MSNVLWENRKKTFKSCMKIVKHTHSHFRATSYVTFLMKTLLLCLFLVLFFFFFLTSLLHAPWINRTIYGCSVRITVIVKFLEIAALKIVLKIVFLYKVVTMPLYVLIQSN